jgi:outer membrane lipoprotein-sorting protein
VRELSFRSLERRADTDGDKSLIVFNTPKDVKDTALLTFNHIKGNDDQWIYLPALKRVKRIASANKSGPFMGSEFAYEDFAAAEVEKFTYRWLRDEPCGTLTCTVIERVPAYDNSGYSRQMVWLDKGELRALKVDYYDQRNQLLKTMTAGAWKQYQGRFWRSHDMMMVNHQTGKTTRLTWTTFTFKAGLRDSDFSETALARP